MMLRVASWLSTIKTTVSDQIKRHPIAYARLRGGFSRHPLPPGDFATLDLLEKADRDFIRKRAEKLGPVFKGIAWDELCICIVGIERCRQFTQAHRAGLRVQTMELGHLIPKGFICAMEGEDHRDIRKKTYRAQRGTPACPRDAREGESVLASIAIEGLREYASRAAEHGNSCDAFSTAMSTIATSMLIWIYFGAQPGTPEHNRFLAHFAQLGPYGLVWRPQRRQEEALRAFRDDLLAEASALRSASGRLSQTGLLARMVEDQSLDDSMLGNLIYQVEMARSDLKNFFRWLTRHATDDPSVLDRIAAEDPVVDGKTTLAESFVMETLRADQSERLMRKVEADIVFEGFLIPRYATVRLCLWESHHGKESFPDPHRFDPERFLAGTPDNDVFAPFGVDHHQCPMGGVATKLGMIFVRALARGYRVAALTPGPPVRGGYHWEPAPRFAVAMTKRA